MIWLLLGPAFACDEVVDTTSFLDEVESAWSAALEDQTARVREIVIGLEPRVTCLSKPLSAAESAAFHRVEAIKALHEGDQPGAAAAASAARRLAPEASVSWGEALPAYAQLEETSTTTREGFATSLAAKVYVDGTALPSRPAGLPVVVQIFTPDGKPVAGGWVDGRDPLPSWVAFPPVACDEAVGLDRIVADVERAGTAYADLDVGGFETALHAVAAGLPCVTGRVGLPQAAAIHRLEGIRLFTGGAEGAAVRSFQQSHVLSPGYRPPETIIPPGSTLADLWDLSARAQPSPWLTVDVPEGLRLVVDGLEASQRPAATPAIVQVTTPSGQVLLSRYVPPGAALPDLTGLSQAARDAERDRLSPAMRLYRAEGEQRQVRLRRTRLLVAGVATLSASGALYIDNAFKNLEYNDPETPHTRLAKLQRSANTSATASSVLLIAGTGIAVSSAFVR